MKEIQVKADVRLPTVPNFLQCGDGGSIDVADVDDADLRLIAEVWGRALLENAQKRRANRREA